MSEDLRAAVAAGVMPADDAFRELLQSIVDVARAIFGARASSVFVTAFENGRLFTQCVDRKSGRLLWERSEARPRAEFGNVRNEPAAMTPVTDGENVYAFFADLGLVSYDAAGNVRWTTHFEKQPGPTPPNEAKAAKKASKKKAAAPKPEA